MKAQRADHPMDFREGLLFERGARGRVGYVLEASDLESEALPALPAELVRQDIPGMPELSEIDVIRHFTRLSRWNYCIDHGLYPLGSCTMKYNPRLHELVARRPRMALAHPYQPEALSQGCLRLIHELEQFLARITGMDTLTLQPSAGAQGELTGMMIIRACLTQRGDPRSKVLIPDSAHGTNPSSAHLCNYQVVEIKSGADGRLHLEDLKARLGRDVAALMLTNPNTLGIFEQNIAEICALVHDAGGLVYCDGANMNALLGISRPGDMGCDVMHLNLHKTFTTPHGGGGPGSGPVAVKEFLRPFLPVPRVVKEGGRYRLAEEFPESIGRVRSFYGNFGMLVRAYAYILSMGAAGLKRVSENAVLNANYIKAGLRSVYQLAYDIDSMHEVIFTDQRQLKFGVKTLDIAKRLMDYGFHPPTIYFPLIAPGALMIEPTETEPRAELDRFIAAMKAIAAEAETDPELVQSAPRTTPVKRLDETRAARQPILRWTPD